MRIQKQSGSDERKLLIAMIVDKNFISHIQDKWQNGLFKSKWSNLIAKWCIRHYKKYDEAPLNQIEHIFENWSSHAKDKESINLIDKFLSSLSEQYESYENEINTQYHLDVANRYFNQVKLRQLSDQLEDSLDRHDLKTASASPPPRGGREA